MTAPRTTSTLRIASALLLLVGGAVHLQQWQDGLRYVPRIGTSFLLNVAASVVVALWLVVRRSRLASLAGIALAGGTLLALLVARYGTLFDYREPTWRQPVVVAVVVELAAMAFLGASLVIEAKGRADRQAAPVAGRGREAVPAT